MRKLVTCLLCIHIFFSRKVGIEKTFLTEGFDAVRPGLLIKTSTSKRYSASKKKKWNFASLKFGGFKIEDRALVST